MFELGVSASGATIFLRSILQKNTQCLPYGTHFSRGKNTGKLASKSVNNACFLVNSFSGVLNSKRRNPITLAKSQKLIWEAHVKHV